MLVCKGRVVCCKEGLETDADGGLERGRFTLLGSFTLLEPNHRTGVVFVMCV